MINAVTPGGHEITVIVFEEPRDGLTHVAECSTCRTQYRVLCKKVDVDIPDDAEVDTVAGERPIGFIREWSTVRAMRGASVDGHLLDHVTDLISFFDEQPCLTATPEAPQEMAQA